jgi:hypothetical protein
VLPVVLGWRTVRDLNWPHDADLYRNMAQAQTMADGDWLADQYYKGETVWYNPLAPAIIAIIAKATAISIPILYTRAGVFLNLLGPIAFYFLVNGLLGRTAALLATFHFLFLARLDDPSWARATYTPWLYSSNFAQAFLYLGLLAYARAPGRAWPWVVGTLLGLSFLGHAAPAVVFGGVMVVCGLTSWASVRRHALALLVALAVASPFLYSILGRYHLRVLNPAGNDWMWPWLTLDYVRPFLERRLDVWLLVVLVGLVALVRDAPRSVGARVVLAWLSVAAALVTYGLASQYAARRGVHLLNIVAIHHFWFYLTAAVSAVWGAAAAWMLGKLPARVRAWEHPVWSTALATAVVGVGLALVYPTYSQSGCFTDARLGALRLRRHVAEHQAYFWLREHTRPDDVVLALDSLAMDVVAPAGRKTVAVAPNFANPYVAWEPRARDRRAMFEHLWRGEAAAFGTLAARYDVAYVLHDAGSGRLREEDVPLLVRVAELGPVTAYRVDLPAGR